MAPSSSPSNLTVKGYGFRWCAYDLAFGDGVNGCSFFRSFYRKRMIKLVSGISVSKVFTTFCTRRCSITCTGLSTRNVACREPRVQAKRRSNKPVSNVLASLRGRLVHRTGHPSSSSSCIYWHVFLSRLQEIGGIGQVRNVELAPSLPSEARTEDLVKYR